MSEKPEILSLRESIAKKCKVLTWKALGVFTRNNKLGIEVGQILKTFPTLGTKVFPIFSSMPPVSWAWKHNASEDCPAMHLKTAKFIYQYVFYT